MAPLAQAQRVAFPTMVSSDSPFYQAPASYTQGAPAPYTPPQGWDPYVDPATPIQPAAPVAPAYPGDSLVRPDGSLAEPQSLIRNLRLQNAWLPGGGSGTELGIDELETSVSGAIPFLGNPVPIIITPGFGMRFLQGPGTDSVFGMPDLPPLVYDAWLDSAWKPRITSWLSADLAVRVGVYSDFDYVNEDSILVTGKGLGVVTLSPKLSLSAGIWYLNRQNIKLLPAGGVMYYPSADTRLDIVFPEPRISHRFRTVGSYDWWWYVGGRIGGGRWTIERVTGLDDRFTYNDYRIGGGLEFLSYKGSSAFVDIAYVFNRQVLYQSGSGNFNPDPTLAISTGINY